MVLDLQEIEKEEEEDRLTIEEKGKEEKWGMVVQLTIHLIICVHKH